jgi:hypothetical protein
MNDLINEVRMDINTVEANVKDDIRAVAIGQVDLKTELKNDTSLDQWFSSAATEIFYAFILKCQNFPWRMFKTR